VADVPNDAGSLGPPPALDAAPGVFTVKIESDGYYSNLQLGTGSVAGTAGVAATAAGSEFGLGGAGQPPAGNVAAPAEPCPPAKPAPYTTLPFDYDPPAGIANDYTAVGYGIDFKNGVGKLGGGAVTPQNKLGDVPDAYYVVGSVNIAPKPPLDACGVAQFTVAGAFVAT
jgi:hypothetical protein